MARFLEPAGEPGMSRMNLNDMGADRPVALATGEAGTVYLCHPFLVHAAQRHRGSMPRFLAQPPLVCGSPTGFIVRMAFTRQWKCRSGKRYAVKA